MLSAIDSYCTPPRMRTTSGPKKKAKAVMTSPTATVSPLAMNTGRREFCPLIFGKSTISTALGRKNAILASSTPTEYSLDPISER